MIKKLFPVYFILGFLISGYSQDTNDKRCLPDDFVTSAPESLTDLVGDFTITDSQGVTRNLYNQLDQGKTVIIDLFFTT